MIGFPKKLNFSISILTSSNLFVDQRNKKKAMETIINKTKKKNEKRVQLITFRVAAYCSEAVGQ